MMHGLLLAYIIGAAIVFLLILITIVTDSTGGEPKYVGIGLTVIFWPIAVPVFLVEFIRELLNGTA